MAQNRPAAPAYHGPCWPARTHRRAEACAGEALNPSSAAAPARSTGRAKPAVVKGEPRSDVNTKSDLGSCSRCSRRRARSSSPMIGCVAGDPFLDPADRQGSLVAAERFDVLQRQLLKQSFFAEPACGVAAAGFLRPWPGAAVAPSSVTGHVASGFIKCVENRIDARASKETRASDHDGIITSCS